MGAFDFISLRSFKIGGQEIGFSKSEKLLHIAGEKWTVGKWLETVDRVHRAMEREGWVEPIPLPHKPVEKTMRAPSFLTANLDKVNTMKGGWLKDPPWFLKPFYNAIVTKDELHGLY